MDFEYSPHRSAGGTMHLLSPTHHSQYSDPLASIKQIRRSLSRSPSKPSRFLIKSPKQIATSPRSPSSLARTQFIQDGFEQPTTRSKFSVRKSAPLKSSARKVSPDSPVRRVLSDGLNRSNSIKIALPYRGSASGQENNQSVLCDVSKTMRSDVCNDEPIKFDLHRSHSDKPNSLSHVLREHATPAKSSPLKRSDGLMNLDQPNFGSPRVKRRSLHGAALGADFNVFEHGFDGNHDMMDSDRMDSGAEDAMSISSPRPQRSPQRRPFSLRKSTLQQRSGSGAPVSRSPSDAPPSMVLPASPIPRRQPVSAMARSRSRMSLDSALSARIPDNIFSLEPPSQKSAPSLPKPHPLSNTLSPSSSASSLGEETVVGIPTEQQQPQQQPQHLPPPRRPTAGFSKSLPIGAVRPRLNSSGDGSQESFETPEAYKISRPFPAAFMSTGLISKRNRPTDLADNAFGSSTNMPDTPCKNNFAVSVAGTPTHRPGLGNMSHPKHEFGSPTTPFSPHAHKNSPESFGKGVSIFGSRVAGGKLIRRSSFLSIDGDDVTNSPTSKLDAQMSTDELPPTPTKPANAGPRPTSKGKGNSLRSSLLGRRSSLAPETFVAPEASASSRDHESYDNDANAPPLYTDLADVPATPVESFTPPDASRLSISGNQHGRGSFSSSTSGLPPMTPTGPRDSGFNFSIPQGANSSSSFQNDVDTTLTSRFGSVCVYGVGEFSKVYRVENPLPDGPARIIQGSPSLSKVWAVKKTKKPYQSSKDRAQKMKEVQILKALKGTEHVIDIVDIWEMKNHLYIQTEFCENGNLKDFLTTAGFKARLDDFRIWKILLEISQGIDAIHRAGYIHLDLKPANIFIDWEGVLKIGDFGMASVWPAPPHLEEGDREYLAPETLAGRFDKPADVFSLGMIMLEIAGNIVLPDRGDHWQRLRAGDMSDLPSLTFSSDSSLPRDASGEPVGPSQASIHDFDDSSAMIDDDDDLGFSSRQTVLTPRPRDLVRPPKFMADANDDNALDRLLQWLIAPNPEDRPVIEQVLASGGLCWVADRRRAGATIYEGNWGPADDVLEFNNMQDIEMLDI